MGQQVVTKRRGRCSSGIPSCGYEARCSVSQMYDSLREAQKYGVQDSPYGTPVYPYVWERGPEGPTLEGFTGPTVCLHMKPPFTAVFGFERQGIGVLIHVAVFDLSEESICKDIQAHIDAVSHLRGTLFGMTQTYVVEAPR